MAEKASFRVKLLVDKKKNKVVLAESGKEFVDVLFSFLTLPMGTIVRLMEKYQKNQLCFNNVYKSVLDIGEDNFMKKACKDMLLYPINLNENQRKKLKINIDDSDTLKYYTCPNMDQRRCRYYSNFCSSKCCICGELMTLDCEYNGRVTDEGYNGRVTDEEIFVSEKNLFIITDNLKVGVSSLYLTLKTLKLLGYSGVDQLHEFHVDVDHEKVLALLQCLFSSNTAFTDLFLTKKISCVLPNLPVQEDSGRVFQSNTLMSLRVFTSKLDKKVIYIESEKDFVDLLFTFLVLPLNSAWKIAGGHLGLECIDNLCESFKSFSKDTSALNNKCILPWCQQPLLDVCYADYRNVKAIINSNPCSFLPIDPTSDKSLKAGVCNGFVKSDTTFMVSDDLTITPMNLSSTICSMKKWDIDLDDIEDRVIKIGRAGAIKLLRASFLTSNALNTVFQSSLWKKPKPKPKVESA